MASEIKFNLKCTQNNDDLLEIQETSTIHDYATSFIIRKNEIIEDFVYKNLETSILQAMKLKIENELMQRKLKNG